MIESCKSQSSGVALLTMQQIEEIIQSTVEATIRSMREELQTTKKAHYLTVKQVCELLPVNPSTVYRWTKEGTLKVYRVQGRRLYRSDEIDSFVNGN